MTSYIYKITNLINGKTYVGQYTGEDSTWKEYMGGGIILKKARKKYGIKNFKKEVIIQGNFNKELINELEKHYIRLYSPPQSTMSYNIDDGGNSSTSSRKTIYQYTHEGEFIREWVSGSNACAFFNTRASNLHAAALGTILQSNGFIWTYDQLPETISRKVNNIIESKKEKQLKNVKFTVYVYKDNTWNTFMGTVKAGKFVNMPSSEIRKKFLKQDCFWINDFLVSKNIQENLPENNYKSKFTKIFQYDKEMNQVGIFSSHNEVGNKLGIDRTLFQKELIKTGMAIRKDFIFRYY